MIIELTVKNFLSFKNETVFSMLASNDTTYKEENTFPINKKEHLLKCAAIYGANGSGKSNFLKALLFMKNFVTNSSRERNSKEPINVEPFRLNIVTENEPSLFEVCFIKKDIKYRYGFEVTKKEVISEWLFANYSSRESQLFIRKGKNIKLGTKFKEGKNLNDKTRENALFLSVVDQFNGEIAGQVIEWFKYLNIISGLNTELEHITVGILKNSKHVTSEASRKIINLIKGADIGIEDISLENKTFHAGKLPNEIKDSPIDSLKELLDDFYDIQIEQIEIASFHKKFDEANNFKTMEKFDFSSESDGTKKLFGLAGALVDTLYNEGVLFVDEIESSMHVLLLEELIKLYCIKNKDFERAQLIFTTHSTALLSTNLFRRDQIWLTEKDKYGNSDMFSLLEFNEHIRKDASLEKNYLKGRYGGTPYIDNCYHVLEVKHNGNR